MEYRDRDKQRIVQELVPGKEITLIHIIANPEGSLYEKVGLSAGENEKTAIGILTVTPAETAIILADIGMKASGIEIGFLDRVSGSLVITGNISQIEASMGAISEYARGKLGFSVCEMTRT